MQQLADLLSRQRPAVREMVRYALILMMIDEERARVVSTRTENGHEYLTVETIAADVFEIMRPEISDELESQLLEQVRAIMEEEADEQRRTP